MKIIELENVYKKYKKNIILNKINYTFEQGKCYLIVGENGSGKTTLLKAILSLINISGIIKKEKLTIGYIPDSLSFPEYVTVYSFLYNVGLIKKVKPQKIEVFLDIVLKEWDLYKCKNQKIKELSKGMKQKVLILQAMMNNPSVYIFDEALNGLDFNMQIKLIDFIKTMKENNKTIIITSHYANMYKEIVDKMLIIKDGEINEGFN